MVTPEKEGLDCLLTRTTAATIKEDGTVEFSAGYSPSAEHSERFAELTKDRNPIHKKHREFGETISPGFLQTAVALGLIDEISGANQAKFPYSQCNAVMNGAVVTGLGYTLQIGIDRRSLRSFAKIIDSKGNVIYELNRNISNSPIFHNGADPANLVHRGRFSLDAGLEDMRGIMGATFPADYIFAIAGASSTVFDAIDHGKLPSPEGVAAMYSRQNIFCDSATPIDLSKGIDLELYLSGKEKFGKLSEKGETVEMTVAAKNDDGRFLYLVTAPISFQQERIVDIMLKRALRSRKK